MIFDYATLKLIWWASSGIIIVVRADRRLGPGHRHAVAAARQHRRRAARHPALDRAQLGGQPDVVRHRRWRRYSPRGRSSMRRHFPGCTSRCCSCCSRCSSGPWASSTATRSKIPRWRRNWDWGLFIGGFVPTLVFGVAFGNLLLGVPFQFDRDLRVFYTGTFWGLLNPFALLAGVVSLALLIDARRRYLQLRTDGDNSGARGQGGAAGGAGADRHCSGRPAYGSQRESTVIVSPPCRIRTA